MINFIRINSTSDPLFADVYELYTSAFPLPERRSPEGYEYQLHNVKNFHSHALMDENRFVGLFNYWTFERFCYIEHFAILPQFRGQNTGTEAMQIFLLQTKLPVVIEAETPKNKLAVRRIHFYERLGFYVLSNYYMQPPYDDSKFFLPMLIMSNDYHFANRHFQLIKSTLYKEVYRYTAPND